MEALVAAINSYDGSGDAAKKVEDLVWDYAKNIPALRWLTPLESETDATVVYGSLTKDNTINIALDAFLGIFRLVVKEKEEKLKKKIRVDFQRRDGESLKTHTYKLLDELLHKEQEYDLDNDADECEKFARDFFPDQPIEFVRWLKEVYGHLYDQEKTFSKFLASIEAGRIACCHLEFLDGWNENFSREEARRFFDKEIIPRTPLGLVSKVWAYFEHDLLCAGDKEPANKRLKNE
jgi:hypothetical protein